MLVMVEARSRSGADRAVALNPREVEALEQTSDGVLVIMRSASRVHVYGTSVLSLMQALGWRSTAVCLADGCPWVGPASAALGGCPACDGDVRVSRG